MPQYFGFSPVLSSVGKILSAFLASLSAFGQIPNLSSDESFLSAFIHFLAPCPDLSALALNLSALGTDLSAIHKNIELIANNFQEKPHLLLNIFLQRKLLLQYPAAEGPHMPLDENIVCQKGGIFLRQLLRSTVENDLFQEINHIPFLLQHVFPCFLFQ